MKLRCLLVLLLLLAAAPAFAQDQGDHEPTDVPAALDVPPGQKLTFEALGVGVQIYACVDGGGSFKWSFVAPEATLYSLDDGGVVGRHYAGPTWQANNGSTVVGSVLARVAPPDPNAIPWLLLAAVAHDGPGLLSEVSYIQRLDTVGGKAPAAGCDAAHLGDEARVPYQAHYLFYKPHDGN
jgi:hypothetical protein